MIKLAINMNLAKHEMLFSKSRLARYLHACGGDEAKSLELYKYNIQASQALYPMISVLEIALRNGIDRELKKYYRDAEWLLNKRYDFAENSLLVYRNKAGDVQPDMFFRNKIQKAESKLRLKSLPISQGRLIADLTFGFWVKFFDTIPIKILKGVPLQAFTNKPGVGLKKVHSHLNSIVTLRNRVSHSEPICFNKQGQLCLDTMLRYIFDIEDALRWIDSELSAWSKKIDFYRPVIIRISNL